MRAFRKDSSKALCALKRLVNLEASPELEKRRVHPHLLLGLEGQRDLWKDWKWASKKAGLTDTFMKQDSGFQKATQSVFYRVQFGYRHTRQLPVDYLELGCRRYWSIKEGNGLILDLGPQILHCASPVYCTPCVLPFVKLPPSQSHKQINYGAGKKMGWDPHPGEKRQSTFLYFCVVLQFYTCSSEITGLWGEEARVT